MGRSRSRTPPRRRSRTPPRRRSRTPPRRRSRSRERGGYSERRGRDDDRRRDSRGGDRGGGYHDGPRGRDSRDSYRDSYRDRDGDGGRGGYRERERDAPRGRDSRDSRGPPPRGGGGGGGERLYGSGGGGGDRERDEYGRRTDYDFARRDAREREREREAGRAQDAESEMTPHDRLAKRLLPKAVIAKPIEVEAEQFEEMGEEDMMALLGIKGFDSTKGKAVETNTDAGEGVARTKQKRKYRQYMNRLGGFNRALDNIQ